MARDSDDLLNEPYPRLPLTPDEGWSLDNFPFADVPTRTELIRGVLVMNQQTHWHANVTDALQAALAEQCPPHFLTNYRMAIRKSPRTLPEPDLSIIRAGAFDLDKAFYLPEDVVLAVEVITPESEERDREDKPVLYAAMGIPVFWLVERGDDDAPIVHEHQLAEDAYRLVNTHVGRLTTDIPFLVNIALTAPAD
jgi:Uma2 family endonuclease